MNTPQSPTAPFKVESVTEQTVHHMQTDQDGWNHYTRHAADNWSVRMGESDESAYNCEELEAAFQEFIAQQVTKPSTGSMYRSWAAFVDIRRDRRHEFPTYESWILSDDAECRSFRQGWAAMQATHADPDRYPDPIDQDTVESGGEG